ncbi:hypothetical protein [Acetobacter oeni]|uniref:Uncharacterized protein n=1 Tax=Acetobacter oeni TaxID=304077 RepID=A0A511XJ20_9PROT|nr:hypothetical protein [Acetobacter oeni]MBB3882683.1 hypothetical protein [Acetobacter oeni]NHO18786.1 hypothetical protein [Acetobacter oeni]GBR06997.1 hypothetical protein AA21952_2197 [Acetobacter oeni LMG 21952]GEN62938.1 hypothetical protein AOE01nite_11620 [Acetobacter oeni]
MEAVCIKQKISSGLAKVAGVPGGNVKLYRVSDTSGPFRDNYIALIKCLFDISASMSGTTPITWEHNFLFALIDISELCVGDYLVKVSDERRDAKEIYFVSKIESDRPVLVVLKNEVISIYESDISSDNNLMGLRASEGPVWAHDRLIAKNWPVSMQESGGGGRPLTHLGTDIQTSGFKILMPVILGIILHQGLRIKISGSNSYHIYNLEKTIFGYRLNVITDKV